MLTSLTRSWVNSCRTREACARTHFLTLRTIFKYEHNFRHTDELVWMTLHYTLSRLSFHLHVKFAWWEGDLAWLGKQMAMISVTPMSSVQVRQLVLMLHTAD